MFTRLGKQTVKNKASVCRLYFSIKQHVTLYDHKVDYIILHRLPNLIILASIPLLALVFVYVMVFFRYNCA